MTKVIDPYQNSGMGADESTQAVTEYGYANDSAAGSTADVADETRLVERPRSVIERVAGVQVGSGLSRYRGGTAVSRVGQGNGAPTWNTAGLQSTVTELPSGFVTFQGPTAEGTDSGAGRLSQTIHSSYFGRSGSETSSDTTLNAFGGVTSSTATAPGMPWQHATAGTADPDGFGRTTSIHDDAAGTTETYHYADDGWFGPDTVTDPDGTVSHYLYTANGRIKSVQVGTVTTTYAYDAAGNVVSTSSVGHSASGPDLTSGTSAAFDVQGRITSYTDELNHATHYAYADSASGTTVTTTYVIDGTTDIERYNLDGTLAEVSGTATLPQHYEYGVDSNGDTWAKSWQKPENWTKSYTNVLGQTFKTETPNSYGEVKAATTEFDATGRVKKQTDFDGTATLYSYDPRFGTPIVVLDVDRDGKFSAGDRKSTVKPTEPTSEPNVYAGFTTTVYSDSGNLVSTSESANGGMDSRSTVNGLTTTSQLAYFSGGATLATTAPDGTRSVDTYAGGLLTASANKNAAGTTLSSVSYGYDALRRNTSITDPVWGTTSYTLRPDGSASRVDYPDGRYEAVTAFDDKTGLPKATRRIDGQTVNTDVGSRGQSTGADGAGVVPTITETDPATGQLSKLKVFRSGNRTESPTNTPDLTKWDYEASTGMLSKKTYADDSQDLYHYDHSFRLDGVTLPGGVTAGAFQYDNVGELNGVTWAGTGLGRGSEVVTTVANRDDRGLAKVVTQTRSNGDGSDSRTSTSATDADALGRPTYEAGDVAGVVVKYAYWPANSIDPAASPGALQSVILSKGGQVIAETDYGYNDIGKRLKTVTQKGHDEEPDRVFTYSYKDQTDLIASIAGPGGTTSFGYEAHNGRLASVGTTAGASSVYSADYLYYDDDQRSRETVNQFDPTGSASAYQTDYTHVPSGPAPHRRHERRRWAGGWIVDL